MAQQLYLIRHAQAEAWNPLGNDFSRPLTSSGKRHAQQLSNWAFESLEAPDTILCSPAKRTRETLSPLLARWPRLLANTDYVDSMYNASVDMLMTLADDAFGFSERLMLVGHNPGIGLLLRNVLQADQAAGVKSMETGTLAVIEFSGDFKRHSPAGHLVELILRADFPID